MATPEARIPIATATSNVVTNKEGMSPLVVAHWTWST